ncbi:putative 2-deoxy-D-gluconate 3-dehydrogenase [Paraburkholderia xenovorans LB400]|nr:putative 2-deoxy-D-gluconate 3-dehydrogenase [Paraburkholderia xenovorans LB400]
MDSCYRLQRKKAPITGASGGLAAYFASIIAGHDADVALAFEWARHGIRVETFAPGYFETELNRDFWQTAAGESLIRCIPQKRLGQLPDLDSPLLLLASDVSRYMTGPTLVIDGGHMVSSL